MSKILDIELELRENYVDSDVTESIVRYINAHGFDAEDVDTLLLELGYDEIFKESDTVFDNTFEDPALSQPSDLAKK